MCDIMFIKKINGNNKGYLKPPNTEEIKMKLLPFPDTPIFLSYHNRAFPFGVVQANSPEDITKWACTKCINCRFYSESETNKFIFAVNDLWGVDEGIMSQQTLQIQEEYFELFNMDLLNILKTAIDNGCYIHGGYNERYVPCKSAYNQMDFMHDFLIIGYNEENFISVGYVDDGPLKRFEIPIPDLVKAVTRTADGRTNINLFKYNERTIPKPNIKRAVEDLNKYISTASYFENPIQKTRLYGIAACIRLKDFFVEEIENGCVFVDKRYLLAFYEHKRILAKLAELFLDSDKDQLVNIAKKNLEMAKSAHMLGLKINCNGNTSSINRIAELMNRIVVEEIKYIPDLIELLQKRFLIV